VDRRCERERHETDAGREGDTPSDEQIEAVADYVAGAAG
jgi:hypothetical protein